MAKPLTQCPLCGATVHEIVVKQLPRRRPDGTCVIFGGIPASRCESCGEHFFASDVSLEMHKTLARKTTTRSRIEVPYYQLSERRGKAASG